MMLVYFSFSCLLLIMKLFLFAKFPVLFLSKVNLSYPTGKEMEFKPKLTLTLITVITRSSKFDIRKQNEMSFDKTHCEAGKAPSTRWLKSSLVNPL